MSRRMKVFVAGSCVGFVGICDVNLEKFDR